MCAVPTTSLNAPRVGDIVHYCPLPSEGSGCRAAVVTEIHIDPHLASLMVVYATGVQFVADVRVSENDTFPNDSFLDKYTPGTWHFSGHQ